MERQSNTTVDRFVTEILSHGRCVGITRKEIDEIPEYNWYKYCQHRLTKGHAQALTDLRVK